MIRKIRVIDYSSHFARAVKKLPKDLFDALRVRETIFRRDCFDVRLKTHKLRDRKPEVWSFSVSYRYRIIFRFLTEDTVYFIDIGDHSVYQ